MIEQAQRPAIGAVGAKLLYGDNTIQHAGVIVVSMGGVAWHHKNSFAAGCAWIFLHPADRQQLLGRDRRLPR